MHVIGLLGKFSPCKTKVFFLFVPKIRLRTKDCIAGFTDYHSLMSVAELKKQVDALKPRELAELSAYIARKDNAEWDAQIDADFSEGGRLRSVLEEVRADIQSGRLEDMP